MLKQILIVSGMIIILGSLTTANPNSIDNTVDLVNTASEIYSNEPVMSS